jgi:hypothetical protein
MKICTIHDERPNYNGNTFAVMLLPIPNMPGGATLNGAAHMQAVIGCSDKSERDDGSFGWVTLDHDERMAIGDALNEHRAEVHRWYWCELWHQDEAA